MWIYLLSVTSVIVWAMGVLMLALLFVTRRHLGTLSAVDGEFVDGDTLVSVVVPARDEEQDLERAVRSLLSQSGVAVEVIVVNDHSRDRTGAICRSLRQGDRRVRVIDDPPLRDGWLGKPNAMEHGRELARGDLVLFTDADVVHSPDCLRAAVGELRRDGLDLLTLVPEFRCESFWENALVPKCLYGALCMFFRGVNDPDRPTAAAAGAFMLIRRDVLTELNGLEPVRRAMADDLELALVVKRRGYKMRCRLAPRLCHVRLFKGNAHAFWGTTKNILIAVDNLWMAVPAMFLPMLVYWVPPIALLVGWRTTSLFLMLAAASAIASQLWMLVLIRPYCRFRWISALCFPLAAIPVFCCFARALWLRTFSGSISWRGRTIRVVDPASK